MSYRFIDLYNQIGDYKTLLEGFLLEKEKSVMRNKKAKVMLLGES